MRLVLAAVVALSLPCLAKDPVLNCAGQVRHYQRWSAPSSQESSTRLVRAVKTNVAGWALVGEGYQLRCDEVASNCGVMIFRSQPWQQPRSGALVHEEPAEAWRGKRYDFSAELRVGAVSDRAQVVLIAQNAAGEVLAISTSPALEGTTSFARQSVSLEVPDDAARVLIGVELVGSGAVYVKELSTSLTRAK